MQRAWEVVQQSKAKQICEKYGYPSEIEALLEALCVLVRENVDGVRSLVLSGSIATGDLVYRKTADGLKIFSDLDLLAFADAPSVAEDFATRLFELEECFRTNLFHVDLSLNSTRALRRIAPSYQMAELRQVDAVLWGADVRGDFPSEIDARFSKQAAILNLWKSILYWPDGDPRRQECFQWTLARLILDVPLLVFSELHDVIPGHFARAQAFGALTAKDHPLATPRIQSAVMRAASMRRAGTMEGTDLWPDFLATLDSLLCYLGLDDLQAQTAPEKRASRFGALIPRRSLRRLGGELRSAMRCRNSVLQRGGWWLRRKEAWAGIAALEAIAWFAKADSQPTLERVAHCLTRFRGEEFRFSGNEIWTKQFRVAYWDGLTCLYPSLRANTVFVRRAGADGSN